MLCYAMRCYAVLCCRQTLISEVLLKAGEVLYVPTQWFHYISNIGINAQCNRRVESIGRGLDCNAIRQCTMKR